MIYKNRKKIRFKIQKGFLINTKEVYDYGVISTSELKKCIENEDIKVKGYDMGTCKTTTYSIKYLIKDKDITGWISEHYPEYLV